MRTSAHRSVVRRLVNLLVLVVAVQILPAFASDDNEGRNPYPERRLAKAADVDLHKSGPGYADPPRPNISGFWRPDPKVPLERFFLLDGKQLPLRDDGGQNDFPYRPEWQKVYDARRKADADGIAYGDPSAACWPAGLYKNYVGYPSPMEVMQTPGRVTLFYQRMSPVRRLYTDGRSHPAAEDLVPTADGHSIGHWEDNTLVVDTVGLRQQFTLSSAPGMPHSDQLHVTERFTRVDPVTLRIEITLDDPKAFTQPVKNTLFYKLWINDGMIEDFCTENNRYVTDENLVIRMDLTARKKYGFDLPK
jgi:hypothetical protein